MISGALYHRVATYSVKNPVWSWSGSATLANPKSQIYNQPKQSTINLHTNFQQRKNPLWDRRWCWGANWTASSPCAAHLPNGCTSVLWVSGRGSSKCGRCSNAASSTVCTDRSPSGTAQCTRPSSGQYPPIEWYPECQLSIQTENDRYSIHNFNQF